MKTAAPEPGRPTAAARPRKLPRVGWLEVVVLSQMILPALMFVPALLRFRFATRVAAFALPIAAWGAYAASGRRAAGGRTYPPLPFLAFAAVWVGASAFMHPNVNTLKSALCALGITLGVLAPAFWCPASIRDPRQLGRLMVLLLACNGASALMGLAQVYRPETFRPPKIAVFDDDPDKAVAFEIELEGGKKIMRPPGLTDTPGGAAMGGQASCAIGLGLALLPIAWWKRGLGLGLALVGLTILFYSQVRVMLITLVLGLIIWAALLALRGEVRKLSMLACGCALLGVVAVSWVLSYGGSGVMNRFAQLFEDSAGSTYYKNRGIFVEYALSETLPAYPLGAGPGRVGMPTAMFGDPVAAADNRPLYAETQIDTWILDGGAPLLLAYALALAAAFLSAAGTALRCPDPEVAFWAGVVLVYAVAVVAAMFGYPAFMAPAGVQFWALMGALSGADSAARARGPAK